VLTRDGIPLVLHDIHLDTVTDAPQCYPDRARADGRWYAIDFSLAELRRLRVHERLDPKTGQPVYPDRFPLPDRQGSSPFRLHTLEEELTMIRGLNRSTGRQVGIYVELKEPGWHQAQDQDLVAAVLPVLARHGYRTAADAVFIQCFDPRTLRDLHERVAEIPLIQLFGEPDWWSRPPTDFAAMRTSKGLAAIRSYAAGIGPWIGQILTEPAPGGQPGFTDLVARAQRAGLLVHPYTLRRDALPKGFDTFDALLQAFLLSLRVDGIFTDHPDLAVRYRDRHGVRGG
jgi:glycerophosphoryl diester phosphodiesterase